LHITIRQSMQNNVKRILLNAKFVFDDHIRCLAAKQRLTKGRIKARQRKMQQIAKLIELSTEYHSSSRSPSVSSSSKDIPRSHSQHDGINKRHHHHHHQLGNSHKPLCRGPAVPGSAVAEPQNKHLKPLQRRRSTSSSPGGAGSRDSSPRATSAEPSEEMIPMEDLSPKQGRRKHRSKSEHRNNNRELNAQDKCERV
jgi:protein CLEC16A